MSWPALLVLSLIVGQFVGWFYMWTHRGLSYSQTFAASPVIIPALVAVMLVLWRAASWSPLVGWRFL